MHQLRQLTQVIAAIFSVTTISFRIHVVGGDHRGDHGLFSHETSHKRTGHVPFTKAGGLKDRLKHLGGAAIKRVLHGQVGVSELVTASHGDCPHQPHHQGHQQNDLAGAHHEGP